jgi:DNA-binding transcriptional regulator YdaS (Cro superfamily)
VSRKTEEQSKFDKFIRGFGVTNLARRLGVHPTAIWHWIDGTTAPHPSTAIMIETLASEQGVSLTIREIYQHCQDVGNPLFRASSLKPKPARV